MPAREHVVHPEGELDIATVPPLCNQWLRAVDQEQPELFVLDLRGVTYLDSSALGALVAVSNRQREHGGDVIVTNANRRLARIFQLTGFGALLGTDRRNDQAAEDDLGDGHWNGEQTFRPGAELGHHSAVDGVAWRAAGGRLEASPGT
jgi:anti-anti-sigma factor